LDIEMRWESCVAAILELFHLDFLVMCCVKKDMIKLQDMKINLSYFESKEELDGVIGGGVC
jgi:hypothetical protein